MTQLIPSPRSFNQGLLGNYAPVAVDMHASKLPAMLSRDPRFLATGVTKGAPGYPDFNPREAVTSGAVSMDDAVKNPTWWEDQPNVKSEYPAIKQFNWKGIGSDMNKEPAQAQAGGWIGGGGVTGLGSPPEDGGAIIREARPEHRLPHGRDDIGGREQLLARSSLKLLERRRGQRARDPAYPSAVPGTGSSNQGRRVPGGPSCSTAVLVKRAPTSCSAITSSSGTSQQVSPS